MSSVKLSGHITPEGRARQGPSEPADFPPAALSGASHSDAVHAKKFTDLHCVLF